MGSINPKKDWQPPGITGNGFPDIYGIKQSNCPSILRKKKINPKLIDHIMFSGEDNQEK